MDGGDDCALSLQCCRPVLQGHAQCHGIASHERLGSEVGWDGMGCCSAAYEEPYSTEYRPKVLKKYGALSTVLPRRRYRRQGFRRSNADCRHLINNCLLRLDHISSLVTLEPHYPHHVWHFANVIQKDRWPSPQGGIAHHGPRPGTTMRNSGCWTLAHERRWCRPKKLNAASVHACLVPSRA